MKQTAVDWVFEQLWEKSKDKFEWNSILKQAKEYEKKQIKHAFEIGFICNSLGWDFIKVFNKYFKQNYK